MAGCPTAEPDSDGRFKMIVDDSDNRVHVDDTDSRRHGPVWWTGGAAVPCAAPKLYRMYTTFPLSLYLLTSTCFFNGTRIIRADRQGLLLQWIICIWESIAGSSSVFSVV